MGFKRIERKEFIKASKLKGGYKEILNRKCSICKEKEWTSEIKSDDKPSFECLTGFGCKDGSAFLCDDCFKSHFEQHSWSFGELFV